jgi:membrane-associated phospholipid phosphatase
VGNLHGVRRETPVNLNPIGVKQAARASALLSVLFLLVYGGTNWLTTLRSDVGVWYADWELAIPFVPLFIVPYMSIDLFFVAAPFLCGTQAELRTFARRVTFAILVAGAFFLVMPLRLGFPREPVEGWAGVIFNTFRTMDAPHNLFPSLHITLRALLADVYARHTRGIVKQACMIWFVLIGVSTVLTHQHHLIDIAGGFMLAGVAFYLFREDVTRLPVTPNRRVGAYYGVVAAATLIVAIALLPAGALLLWPALALGMVTAGYYGVGPGIFRKTDGRLPWSTRFVLAPVLVAQYLSLVYYRRQCRAWDVVVPGVVIGRVLTDTEAGRAIDEGVTAVLDLTGEFSEAASFANRRRESPGGKLHAAKEHVSQPGSLRGRFLTYRNLPVLDLTAPTQTQLAEAVRFIAEHAASGTVYVHCKIGYSRSAGAVGAYLLYSGAAAGVEQAVAMLRAARPTIIVRDEILDALIEFHGSQASASAAVAQPPALTEMN